MASLNEARSRTSLVAYERQAHAQEQAVLIE